MFRYNQEEVQSNVQMDTINTEESFRQQLTNHGLIVGLRQYIRKNKVLPAFFEAADQDEGIQEKSLPALIEAVATGNYESPIFNDADCDNLILYAVEKELIDFWPGMTAFTYVTALAQFTNARQLKDRDDDVKSVRGLSPAVLVKDGKITEFGDRYLAELNDFFRAYGAQVDFADLRKAILELPVFEQTLVRIDQRGVVNSLSDDVNELLHIMMVNLPFCDGNDGKTMLLPSYGLVNLILRQFEPEHVQMKPVFGRLSDQTRDALHAQDQHPVSLYSNSVGSNIPTVHTKRAGPIPIWLHDIGHTVLGTMLGYQNRKLIVKRIVPVLNRMIERDDTVDTLLGINSRFVRVKNKFNDYDLSPLPHFMKPDEGRLGHYVSHCLGKDLDLVLLMKIQAELYAEIKVSSSPGLLQVFNAVNKAVDLMREREKRLQAIFAQVARRRNTVFTGVGGNIFFNGNFVITSTPYGFFGRVSDNQVNDIPNTKNSSSPAKPK